MPRSSESVAALASALGQGAGRARQPGEVADRHHPERPGRGGGAQLPLCPALERARHRAQDAGPARDRHRADHGASTRRPAWST